jgi:hypothetical protein
VRDSLKSHFLLDPRVVFLNHGSFGACPRPVFETYQRWQRELERQPVEFLARRAEGLMAEARTRLAGTPVPRRARGKLRHKGLSPVVDRQGVRWSERR